ncbi:MAG TPA: CBS domain-containing protein, partial [Gemmatimonadales bacterium]|nr:CBS domain-containing protein [Gemmatimonadales bacterium]
MTKALKAKDIALRPPVTVHGDATLEEAALLMLQLEVGSLLVVDDRNHLVGILTDADFGVGAAPASEGEPAGAQVLGSRLTGHAERIYRAARTRRVRDVMNAPVVTVEADDSIETVLARMFENHIRHIPVVSGRRPVGMISTRDLLQLLFAKSGSPSAARRGE